VPISHKSGQAFPLKVKNQELAKAAATKASGMETRRGGAGRKDKAVGKEDSPFLSTGGAVEGLLEAAAMRDGSPNTVNGDPAQKEKTLPKSPTKVNPQSGIGEEGSTRFVGSGITDDIIAGSRGRGTKLLILNIHGTLLDCSLKADGPSASSIRSSIVTDSRRVIFRPWLMPFLTRCFINFIVAFWGSKSECYMDEMAVAILARLKGGKFEKSLFVWSGKHCEPIDFEDGEPICWGKPLSKVFHLWPAYNLSNTVVVDHKSFRVGCNPSANVIIPTPFYVQHMEKLEEDRNYLKYSLWPLLEGFFASKDIQQFRSFYPQSFLDPHTRVPKVYELQGESGISSFVEGEGTGEPYGSASHVSPHLLV
jgi:hypothetical protein